MEKPMMNGMKKTARLTRRFFLSALLYSFPGATPKPLPSGAACCKIGSAKNSGTLCQKGEG